MDSKETGDAIPPLPPRQPDIAPHVALLPLVVGYALVDFMTPAVVEKAGPDGWVLAAFLTGVFCGQAGFLTVWAALGPFRLWVRWLLVLLTSFGLYFSFCFGMAAFTPYIGSRDSIEMAAGSLLIPLLFLSVQLPLWIRKTLGGWQIVLASEASRHSAAEARQYGLLHILGLTAALAVALSLGRAAMVNLGPSGQRSGQMAPEMWLTMGIMCVVACLYSAVWTLSSAWACFLARDKGMGCGVMAGVWMGVSILLIAIMVVGSAVAGADVPGEATAIVFLHFAGTAVVLMGSLHLLRLCGCVMIRTGKDGQS